MDRRGCRSYWFWGAFGAVAYADHLVVSISLIYLYILPVGIACDFPAKENQL